VWELSAKKIDDHTCEYSNHIHASATDEFLTFIEKNDVTFEQARAARQQASDSHNREETPNFCQKHRTQISIKELIIICRYHFSGIAS
jgi:hypothetical protein